MQIFTFLEYYNIIPADTKKFIDRLLCYLSDDSIIDCSGKKIYKTEDKLLFKALKAYVDSSEINANTAQKYGYQCS